jgi:hypothetical protein
MRDGKLSVFITFSRPSQLWYDLCRADLLRWLAYVRAFVVFVLGSESEVLIIPVQPLQTQLRHLTPAQDDSYKLHVVEQRGTYSFHELPGFDLTTFCNNYGSLMN